MIFYLPTSVTSRPVEKKPHLLKELAEAMIDSNQGTKPAGNLSMEDKVGCKHGDQDKEAFAGQPHDGQRRLHKWYEVFVGSTLHFCQL